MSHDNSQGGFIIIISFFVAYILTVIPMSETLTKFRPEWVTLVLIYWCIYVPHRVGIIIAWIAGLFMDVIYGVLLGQYALSMSIVAFSSYKIQTRFRLYPNLQQALVIILLIAILQMIILWVKGINGQAPQTIAYWLPSITSAIVWPFVSFILGKLHHMYGVS